MTPTRRELEELCDLALSETSEHCNPRWLAAELARALKALLSTPSVETEEPKWVHKARNYVEAAKPFEVGSIAHLFEIALSDRAALLAFIRQRGL